MSRAAALALVGLLAAACGGASDEWAGLSRTGALQQASQAVAESVNDPADPLRGHRLRLLGLARGRDLAGDKAWLARYEDVANGDRFCIWVSAKPLSTKTSLRPCGSAPPPPAPPPQPPALS